MCSEGRINGNSQQTEYGVKERNPEDNKVLSLNSLKGGTAIYGDCENEH